jgi:hypothetical protein
VFDMTGRPMRGWVLVGGRENDAEGERGSRGEDLSLDTRFV